jgi:hypothetical protein
MKKLTAEEFLAHYRSVSRDCENVELGAWTQPLTRRLEMLREDAQAAFMANDDAAIEKAASALNELGREVAQHIKRESPRRTPLTLGEDGQLDRELGRTPGVAQQHAVT